MTDERLTEDERIELELLRRNRDEHTPGPWIQRAFDMLGTAKANAAQALELRSLLADALYVQRFPCDHAGIGKPGCAICDPRVYPVEAERRAEQLVRTPQIQLAADDVDDQGRPNEWVAAGMAEAAASVGMFAEGDVVPASWAVPLGWAADNEGTCRSCRAEVLWCVTPAGKKAPINRDGTSHFSTCPQAADWRKRA